MEERRHPLEAEELIVTVSVIHVLSGQEGTGQEPAGTFMETKIVRYGSAVVGRRLRPEIDIQEATSLALKTALDRLLTKIEIQGGG